MKKVIVLIALLSHIIPAYCQYDFLFQRKSLDQIRIYEDSLKSKNLGYVKTKVSQGYFPTAINNHDYFPLKYIRTNDPFYPELHVEYFYNERDSTLLAASYDWNIMDYVSNIKTDGHKFEQEQKREKEYLAKYNEVYSYMVAKLGKPEKVEENKSETDYFYSITWKKDNTEVLMLFKFSKQLRYLPGDLKIGSYNIRVKVNYTN